MNTPTHNFKTIALSILLLFASAHKVTASSAEVQVYGPNNKFPHSISSANMRSAFYEHNNLSVGWGQGVQHLDNSADQNSNDVDISCGGDVRYWLNNPNKLAKHNTDDNCSDDLNNDDDLDAIDKLLDDRLNKEKQATDNIGKVNSSANISNVVDLQQQWDALKNGTFVAQSLNKEKRGVDKTGQKQEPKKTLVKMAEERDKEIKKAKNKLEKAQIKINNALAKKIKKINNAVITGDDEQVKEAKKAAKNKVKKDAKEKVKKADNIYIATEEEANQAYNQEKAKLNGNKEAVELQQIVPKGNENQNKVNNEPVALQIAKKANQNPNAPQSNEQNVPLNPAEQKALNQLNALGDNQKQDIVPKQSEEEVKRNKQIDWNNLRAMQQQEENKKLQNQINKEAELRKSMEVNERLVKENEKLKLQLKNVIEDNSNEDAKIDKKLTEQQIRNNELANKLKKLEKKVDKGIQLKQGSQTEQALLDRIKKAEEQLKKQKEEAENPVAFQQKQQQEAAKQLRDNMELYSALSFLVLGAVWLIKYVYNMLFNSKQYVVGA